MVKKPAKFPLAGLQTEFAGYPIAKCSVKIIQIVFLKCYYFQANTGRGRKEIVVEITFDSGNIDGNLALACLVRQGRIHSPFFIERDRSGIC